MSMYLIGTDILGADVTDPDYVKKAVEVFDERLTKLQPITYSIAETIAKKALDYTYEAEKIAKSNSSKYAVLGPAMYENPRGHIRWHLDNMKVELAGRDPTSTLYERAPDLKKWVVASYRSYMSFVQSKEALSRVTDEFWSDVLESFLKLPENLRQTANDFVEKVTGVPVWVWVTGSIVVTSAVGYGVFKILQAAAPSVAGEITRRYLP